MYYVWFVCVCVLFVCTCVCVCIHTYLCVYTHANNLAFHGTTKYTVVAPTHNTWYIVLCVHKMFTQILCVYAGDNGRYGQEQGWLCYCRRVYQ